MTRVAIIGLGLIGGSIGMALKQAAVPNLKVVGFARNPDTARRARDRGAVDAVAADLVTAVAGADVVFISTPASAIPDILRHIAAHLPQDCVVTDTASTKAQVMAWARQCLPATAQFIGGHPMAGKETTGIEVAEAALFRGCTYCLVPGDGTSPQSLNLLSRLVEAMGARPMVVEAQLHDGMVAGVSHLPALVSVALCSTVSQDVNWPLMSRLASSGFRDVTRLASSDPRMNRDIYATNRQAVVAWVDRFIAELTRLLKLVEDDEEALEQMFYRVSQARQAWLEHRYPPRDRPL